MFDSIILLLCLFLIPIAIAAIFFMNCMSLNRASSLNIGSQFTILICSSYLFLQADAATVLSFFNNWFRLDALSSLYLILTTLISFLVSLYSYIYFSKEKIERKTLNRFYCLWNLTVAAGALVLISNNIALMWVALEATTVFSAFLICTQRNKASLEAMWKYLILCSIGVAFAFIGTLLVRLSAQNISAPIHDILLWSTLNEYAPLLQINFLKAGFIFLLVGYGTKAGIAPMHTWMPDAYSHAPAPFGALSSGLLINLAIYALSRFIPITEKATAFSHWAHNLLILMGCVTLLIAMSFILFQKNIKRLLAYSSIEHIGMITLALGIPGAGAFASLFHTINHSLSKSLAFFCVGRLKQIYQSLEIDELNSTLKVTPIWGTGFLIALLTLIGAAPFAIFMSKLLIIKALVNESAWFLIIFLGISSSFIFIGVLKYILNISWRGDNAETSVEKSSWKERILVLFLIILLITFCFWLPVDLERTLYNAAKIITGV